MHAKWLILFFAFIFIGTIVYAYLLSLPPEYKTREECEVKTEKTCYHNFGDHVAPEGFVGTIKAKWCEFKMPRGWAPAKYFPSCVWPVESV